MEDAKLDTGLTHWAQKVVSEAPVEPETESEEPSVSVEDVRTLQTGAGFKTRAYLKAVKENKVGLPEEYELVKHHIERYL